MRWVNSAGGPLVCGEPLIVSGWRGVEGLSGGGSTGVKNDYERACATRGYLEILTCGNGRVLILGDEPLQSSFFLTNKKETAIARWVFARSHDMEELLCGLLDRTVELARPLAFEVAQGVMTLFDSALPSHAALDVSPTGELEVGRYLVTTEKFEVEKSICFLIHKFMKKSE